MARRARRLLPDGWFHVTCRGVDGIPIFIADVDQLSFLSLLLATAVSERWTVEALCLMGNHYHLIVRARRADLSAGMHRLNGIYAQDFNRRCGRRGHLFGDRFAFWVIESEEHLTAAVGYVLLNPVRAGLCARAEDWPWSGVAPRWRERA